MIRFDGGIRQNDIVIECPADRQLRAVKGMVAMQTPGADLDYQGFQVIFSKNFVTIGNVASKSVPVMIKVMKKSDERMRGDYTTIILCDRYWMSTYGYQGAQGIDKNKIIKLKKKMRNTV